MLASKPSTENGLRITARLLPLPIVKVTGDVMTLSEKRKAAGRMGGLATVNKHGKEHMAAIGKKGAAALYKKYQLVPAAMTGWALISRETGAVVAIW
jgi:hypothetical protein